MEDPHMQDEEEEADSSSGEYETDSDSDSDSDSGSEEDVAKADVTKTPEEADQTAANTTPAKPNESGSETAVVAKKKESRGSAAAAASASTAVKSASKRPTNEETLTPAKPVASETVVVTKNKESGGSASASTAVKSALKRPASEETSTPVKRAKTRTRDVKNNIGQESGKARFEKVWSEEDPFVLLNSMIEFNHKEGNPYLKKSEFDEYVKDSFSFSPNHTQLTKKMLNLKNKYLDKVKKSVKDNDKEFMELAEKIWGPSAFADASVVKSVVKAKKIENKYVKPVEEEEVEEEDASLRAPADPGSSTMGLNFDWFETSSVVQSMVTRGLHKAYVKQEWNSAAMEDKKLIEVKCKLLHEKKVEFVQLETELMHEFTSRIFKST